MFVSPQRHVKNIFMNDMMAFSTHHPNTLCQTITIKTAMFKYASRNHSILLGESAASGGTERGDWLREDG